MTAPASIPLPRADVRAPMRESGQAARNTGAEQGRTRGFAAYLAQEAPPAERSAPHPTTRPAKVARATEAPADAASPVEEPGKALPATRQNLAAPVAAFRVLVGIEDQTEAADAQATSSDQAETDLTAETPVTVPNLSLALPLAASLPSTAPAPLADAAGATSAATGSTADAASPSAPRAGEAATKPAAPTGPQTASPAAFSAAGFVLERDASALAGETAPTDARAAPPVAEAAARAQPSTLAVLTGEPERPGMRKLRVENETSLPATKSAVLPDTAGALALAQPASAPAAAAGSSAPVASAPQPLSFDQLVDSIARARDGVDQGGPVAVALHHGEFGRISLRIESDATGLSVAMASPDPAFAPAVAAAHAAAAVEPARGPAAEHRGDAAGQGLAQGQSGNQSSQQRQPAVAQRAIANPAQASAPDAERRSGIFA